MTTTAAVPVTDPFKVTAGPAHASGGGHPLAPGLRVRAEVLEVTPDMAREWIRRHEQVVGLARVANGGKARDNRPLRFESGVDKYSRDMKGRRWVLNGESIKIAWNETITDGQHRLQGCIAAGVPFWSVVVFGVDPESQDTVDVNLPRRLSDQLGIMNEKNPAVLATVTRWSLRWLHGVRSGSGGGGWQPTMTEQLEYLEADPRLRIAADFGARAKAEFKPVRATVWAMAWMVLHGADHMAAEVFLERAVDGAELPRRHPVLVLRDRMVSAKVSGERLTETEQLALFVIAWNYFRDDREPSILKLPVGGLTAKNFPEPK